MKRCILLAVAGLLFLSWATQANADRARVVADHSPPWKIVDGDEVVGIDIQLVSALLKEVGITPKFEAYPWKRCLTMMQSGEADILTGVLKRPQREEYMHFIDPPTRRDRARSFT